jgi:hypothetical protein
MTKPAFSASTNDQKPTSEADEVRPNEEGAADDEADTEGDGEAAGALTSPTAASDHQSRKTCTVPGGQIAVMCTITSARIALCAARRNTRSMQLKKTCACAQHRRTGAQGHRRTGAQTERDRQHRALGEEAAGCWTEGTGRRVHGTRGGTGRGGAGRGTYDVALPVACGEAMFMLPPGRSASSAAVGPESAEESAAF